MTALRAAMRPAIQGVGRSGFSVGLGLQPAAVWSKAATSSVLDVTGMLYSDAAGTVPVTAVEQFVGQAPDASGRGNHWTQSTGPARPAYSARVNVLTDTEGLLASYAVFGSVALAGSSIDGADNALQLGSAADAFAYKSASFVVGTQVSFSATVQMGDLSEPAVGSNSGTGDLCLVLTGDLIGPSPSLQNGNSYRVRATRSASVSANFGVIQYAAQTGKLFKITKYQAEIGSASRYQKVITPSNYDTSGFSKYLRLDQADDVLNTPAFFDPSKPFVWCFATQKAAASIDLISTGATTASHALLTFALDKIRVVFVNSAGVATLADSVASYATGMYIVTMIYTGAQLIGRINGVQVISVAVTGTAASVLRSLSTSRPSFASSSKIYGIHVLADVSLLPHEIQVLERDLANKAQVTL